jgi:transglutaminase-like putative cysteine protease
MATIARPIPARRIPDGSRVTEVVTLLLHALLVVSVVAAMRRVDAGDRNAILAPLAVAGLLLGYLLARTRTVDMIAHSVALWTGGTAAILVVSLATDGVSGIVDSRGRSIVDLAASVVRSLYQDSSDEVGDTELVVVLGITAWLLAYCSAWVIYRRGWFLLGVAVPAAILLASMRLDERSGGWPLALFIFAAIALATRHALAANSLRWARRNMLPGPNLTGRFLFAGLPVAVVAVIVAAAFNPALHDSFEATRSEQLTERWYELRDSLADLLGPNGGGSESYASFPDSFDLDSDVDLSDEVVARVRANGGNYLALRRHDTYENNRWASRVDDTFRLDNDPDDIHATSIIFNADQDVAYSDAVMSDRAPESAVITVERPKDDLIFTIETFSSASRQVLGVMSWRQLDEFEVNIAEADVRSLPVELQAIVASLKSAQFEVDSDSGEVTLSNTTEEKAYRELADNLEAYPIEAELAAGENGELLLVVSGRLPNYDDIEAIYASSALEPGTDYRVIGLSSYADADELASAPTDYPVWLANRYLQLPDSVTERTRSAADMIVAEAGASNLFDMAWAIQEYLRANYTYELNGPKTPKGQDYVDFFLFDHKIGRCTHFATAMVVLVRSLGIPARLVSGYNYSGEQNANGEVLYRELQAHTWVEVFFPGYGWIPFEPTTNQPSFGYGGDNPGEETTAPEGSQATPEPEVSPGATQEPTLGPDATPDVPALAIDDTGDGSGLGRMVAIAVLALACAALGFAGLFALRWRWRLRGLGPASGLFARLQRVGAWFGVRTGEATTPNEFGRALTRVLPGSDAAVRSITTAYYVEQFDPEGTRGEIIASANSGWKQLRGNLWRWRLRRRRR